MVAIIKPRRVIPKNETELKNLVEGDIINVNVDNSSCRFLVYEGLIEDKYSFLEPTKDGILSWRCEKELIGFSNNGMSFLNHRQVELYTSKHENYQEKLELLRNSIEEVIFGLI